MRFIGDVHGKFTRYKTLIKQVNRSVVVGDMGVGFRNRLGEFTANPPRDSMKRYGDHRFIRGNHDNPGVCLGMELFIRDGTFDEQNSIFYVGGAASIDRDYRTENYDWWAAEELTYTEFMPIIDAYEFFKPRVVVTHDGPESIVQQLFAGHYKFGHPSITRQAFDSMFAIHQPELWVHGHWHKRRDSVIGGTRFLVLAELDWVDVDINTLNLTFNPTPR